ncbi:MAG TPA: hypothetical protein GXX18_13665 [Bacillales bacterium]|nr:hypothetical protein [Bacillales bacterium]
MRREIQSYLQSRPDMLMFVRESPGWYRKLSRSPEKVFEIEQEAKIFYGRTFPQRMDRLNESIQFANMLLGMMNVMGNNN